MTQYVHVLSRSYRMMTRKCEQRWLKLWATLLWCSWWRLWLSLRKYGNRLRLEIFCLLGAGVCCPITRSWSACDMRINFILPYNSTKVIYFTGFKLKLYFHRMLTQVFSLFSNIIYVLLAHHFSISALIHVRN